eukprot:SAG22_NODE_20539_length_265_cov_0.560241_1_plen_52_part_01
MEQNNLQGNGLGPAALPPDGRGAGRLQLKGNVPASVDDAYDGGGHGSGSGGG